MYSIRFLSADAGFLFLCHGVQSLYLGLFSGDGGGECFIYPGIDSVSTSCWFLSK